MLTPAQYAVLRQANTERSFSSPLYTVQSAHKQCWPPARRISPPSSMSFSRGVHHVPKA